MSTPFDSNPTLQEASNKSRQLLQDFANDEKFAAKMTEAFGSILDSQQANLLFTAWQQEDFHTLPTIEIRQANEINGANGAFAKTTNTIYISQEYLAANAGNSNAVVSVLLEEIGHYIDSRINQRDAAGDEGAIFSALVRGENLSQGQLQALKIENDFATVNLDGTATAIEQSGTYTGSNLGESVSQLSSFFSGLQNKLDTYVSSKSLPLLGANLWNNSQFKYLNTLSSSIGAISTSSLTANDLVTRINGISGLSATNLSETANTVTFDVKLQSTKTLSSNLASSLGLSWLGLDVAGSASVGADFSLSNLKVVIDKTNGITLQKNSDLQLGINTSLSNNFSAVGKIGLLQVEAKDDQSNSNGSQVKANLVIDTDGSTNTFAIDNLNSDLKFDLKTSLPTVSFLGSNFSLPTITTDLDLILGSGGVTSADFKNVSVNLGTNFLSGLKAPIDKILKPIQPFIDLLSKDIEPLSRFDTVKDLFDINNDNKVTLVDFIYVGDKIKGNTKYGENVDNFLKAVNSIKNLTSGTLFNSPGFTLSSNSTARDTFGNLVDSSQANTKVNSQTGLYIPMLDTINPDIAANVAYDLFLGKNVPLFSYQLPKLNLANFRYDQFTPLIGPLGVNFGVDLNASAQFGFGYDTWGLNQYLLTKDVGKIKEGFYISDRANADGSGRDIAEIVLGSRIRLEGGANLGIGKGFVGGNISGTLNFNLHDGNNDGKIRPSEIPSNLLNLFDIDANISAGVQAWAEVGYGMFSKRFDWSGPEVKLIELNRIGSSPTQAPFQPFLATSNAGILSLYMGLTATSRNVNPDEINETFQISLTGSQIKVRAFGQEQLFTGITQVSALGDAGNDVIELSETLTTVVANFSGGDGRDNLTGGVGSDTLVGGDEDDILSGRGGIDILSGDAGNDVLDGGVGNDDLTGGLGEDRLFGRSGNDTLTGGDGNDQLAGNDGDDTLRGGQGVDNLQGEVGNDTLSGDAGNDVLDGGAGDDNLSGGTEEDRLFGGSNNDTLAGGDGNDQLGGDDGDDTISGGQGVDNVQGGIGNDRLDGGTENDVLSGNAGIDTLLGGDGDDKLYGGTEADILEGGNNNDELVGEAGDDTLKGDSGKDVLKGAADNDILYGGLGDDYLEGGTQNDSLYGNEDNDILFGGSEDDRLEGGQGVDRLYGDDGVDTLLGGTENDVLFGGNENDNLQGNENDDQLLGENGVDTLLGGAGVDNLYGGLGDDILSGGTENDYLEGGEGSDRLWGGEQDTLNGEGDLATGGDDKLFGGAGNDFLYGGTGNDKLEGEVDDDALYGNAGNDTITGGQGIDSLYGGAGTDSLSGGTENDILSGGTGNDVLEGGTGNDTLWGGDLNLGDNDIAAGGDDTLYGGTGNDKLYGGVGNDKLEGEADNDELYGNVGNDTLIGSFGNDILNGGTGNDTLDGGDDVDTLDGGAGDDILNGGQGNDTLRGIAGKDTLYGEAGNDNLDGGTEDDLLIGGIGTDTLVGNLGADKLYGGYDNDILKGDAGADFLYGEQGNDTIEGGADADLLEGGEGDDTLKGDAGIDILKGEEGIDTLYGGTENDSLDGGEGQDTLYGEAGNDTLIGGEGVDLLYGGAQDDFLQGGLGQDTLYGGTENDTLEGGADNDTLEGDAGTDILRGEAGDDKLYGGAGGDTLEGGEGNDLLVGDKENDPKLASEGGNDTLKGGVGDDRLFGYLGDDVLYGGEGKDWLEGGFGNDTLYGGTDAAPIVKDNDADVYALAPGSGTDTIYGFDPNKDVLYLSKGLTFAFIKIEGKVENINGRDTDVTYIYDLDDYNPAAPKALARMIGIKPTDLSRANIDEENVAPNRLEFESKKPIYAKDETVTLVNTVVRDANGADDLERIDFWLKQDATNWQDISDVGFRGVDGSAVWKDYNNDGFTDLLVAGYNHRADSYPISIYQNNKNGTFTQVNVKLPQTNAYQRGVTWGDYDKDGDLDILGSGYIIRNISTPTAPAFDPNVINVSLISSPDKTGLWQDYDGDNDLDLLMSGKDVNGTPFLKLYQNNNNSFSTTTPTTDFATNISGIVSWNVAQSPNAILSVGKNLSGQLGVNSYLYDTTNQTYSSTTTFQVVETPNNKVITPTSVDWYDYNQDGKLDFILTGSTPNASDPNKVDGVTLIYKRSDTGFTLAADLTAIAGADLTKDGGVVDGDVAWGEVNGKATFIVTGNSNQYRTRAEDLKSVKVPISKVYQFNGTSTTDNFVEISSSLTGVYHDTQGEHVSWQDYDKDNDLDILLTGKDFWDNPVTLLYRNDAGKFTNAIFNPLVTDSSLSTFNYSLTGLTPGSYVLKGTAYDHQTAAQEYTLVPGSGEGTGDHALVLDGVDDYVLVPHANTLNTPTVTVEAWIKGKTTGIYQKIIGKGPDDAEAFGLWLTPSGTLEVNATINGGQLGFPGNVVIGDNTWHHVAYAYDGTRNRIYIDGVLQPTYPINGTLTPNNEPISIGREVSSTTNAYTFNGQLDDVRVWNVARSQQQIQENMTRPLTGSQTGLAGYWNFDRVSGNTITDLSGNLNNGQLLSGATVSGESVGDRALVLDGADDYVNLGNPTALQITGSQTIEMWLKPTNFNNRQNPYAKAYGGEGTITVETDGTVSYYYGINGTDTGSGGITYQGLNTGISLKSGQWNHLSIVRDLTAQKLYWYINGEKVNETDAQFTAAVAGNNSVYIGKGYVNNFAGQIDEVRVWNVARSQQQIQENMNRQLTGTQTGLAGYWTFDQANAGTVVDLSGNNNNGQLLNGASLSNFAKLQGAVEFRVNTNTSDNQLNPSVAALSNGGFVVTWQSYGQDGSAYGTYGQVYNASGAPQGSEFRVNTFTTSDQYNPSVTALSNGGFVVTWTSYYQDGTENGIYGQVFDAGGTRQGSEFPVNTYTTSYQSSPSVAALSNGGFVVTWQSYGQDGSAYGIYGQVFNAGGTRQGSEFLVNTYTTSYQSSPSVAALSNGGFVVTWQSYGQDGTEYGIYGQVFNASGIPQGSEFPVNTYTTSDQVYSSVTALSNGDFVVTWQSNAQDGSNSGIYGQVFNASGTRQGSDFQVNTYTSDDQAYPSVGALSNGGFVVTWHSYGQDGSTYGIYGQVYDASGTRQGSEFLVNTYTSSDQSSPSVAALSNGGFVVTWESSGQDGSAHGIYAQVFDLSRRFVLGESTRNFYGYGGQVDNNSFPNPTGIPALIQSSFLEYLPNQIQVYGSDTQYHLAAIKVDGSGNITYLQNSATSITAGQLLTGSLKQELLNQQATVLLYSPKGWTESVSGVVSPKPDPSNDQGIAYIVGVVAGVGISDNTSTLGLKKTIPAEKGNIIFVSEKDDFTHQTSFTINTGGTEGDDPLQGTSSADKLTGGGGNDVLIGQQGSDYIDGGTGNDTLQGNAFAYDANNSYIWLPDSGNNQIYGWEGDDQIWGSDGNDLLDGGEGNDIINAGPGQDILIGAAGNDSLDGGDGIDVAIYAKEKNSAVVNLTTGRTTSVTVPVNSNNPPTATTPKIAVTAGELVVQPTGTAFKLSVSLSQKSTQIVTVNFTTANGTATAGTGATNDYTTTAGKLTFAAGQTTQTILIPIQTAINTSATAETFTLSLNTPVNATINQANTVITLTRDVLKNIENVSGSQFSDSVTGDVKDNILEGLGGNDVLKGEGGNDTLTGGAGNDYLDGGVGNNILEAGGGADTLVAGIGNDTYKFQSQWLSLEDAFVALGGDEQRLGQIISPTGQATNWNTFQLWKYNAQYDSYQNFGLEVDLQRQQQNQTWLRLASRKWLTPEQAFTTLGGGEQQQNYITNPKTQEQISWSVFNGWVNSEDWTQTKLADFNVTKSLDLKALNQGWLGVPVAPGYAGSSVKDDGGTDVLVLPEGVTLSSSRLYPGQTGLAQVGNDLIIDLNQDGVANASQDLSIKDFFNGNLAGAGFIENIKNFSGTTIPGTTILSLAQAFTPINTPFSTFTNVSQWQGSSNWGDYDNDGDLDLLVTGQDSYGSAIAKIYANNYTAGSTNTSIIFGNKLPQDGHEFSLDGLDRIQSTKWGDYDNDGDLDLLIIGHNNLPLVGNQQIPGREYFAKVYSNKWDITKAVPAGESKFTVVQSVSLGKFENPEEFGNIAIPAVDWADYNNDGKLDILSSTSDKLSTPLRGGSLNSADYNNDGFIDVVVTGIGLDANSQPTPPTTLLYKGNGNGTFTQVSSSLIGVKNSTVAWGDYNNDNDGNLDFLLAGSNATNNDVIQLYTNNGNGTFPPFSPITTTLKPVSKPSLQWGDYNNDGNLDVLLTGTRNGQPITEIYNGNGAGGFNLVDNILMTSVQHGEAKWGDYDKDGDLDIIVTGAAGRDGVPFAQVYRNNLLAADKNIAPAIPEKQKPKLATVTDYAAPAVNLIWAISGTDDNTPVNALTYNLKVGTTAGGSDILNPLYYTNDSNPIRDFRQINAGGNVGYGAADLNPGHRYWTLTNLKPGATYYWNVQAIDAGGMASSFGASTEGSFTVNFLDWKKPKSLALFNSSGADVTAVPGTLAWGDYDSDGKLDIVKNFTLYEYDPAITTSLAFKQIVALPFVANDQQKAVAWADYDQDGDRDLLVVGSNGTTSFTRLYTNTNNQSFSYTTANANLFPGITATSVQWGDYNLDGKLDILVVGKNAANQGIVTVYQQKSDRTFTSVATLTGGTFDSASWGDLNGDKYLDILVTGTAGTNNFSGVYRNNQGNFSNFNLNSYTENTAIFARVGLETVANPPNTPQDLYYRFTTASWGDADNDGDLDLLLAGRYTALVYENKGLGTFGEMGTLVLRTEQTIKNATWFDANNDGSLDITLSREYTDGTTKVTETDFYITKLQKTPTQTTIKFNKVLNPENEAKGSVALIKDYDGDGRAEFFFDTGKVYPNLLEKPNTAPTAPTGLEFDPISGTLSWKVGTDTETETAGLSYNLRVGTKPGGEDVIASIPLEALQQGSLIHQQPINGEIKWKLNNLPEGIYYWSVQTVDTAFKGSDFASERVFNIGELTTPEENVELLTPTINNSALKQGSTASVSFTLKNQGEQTPTLGYEIFLSQDATLDSADISLASSDLQWTTGQITGGITLNPGASQVITETITIPTSLPGFTSGNQYLLFNAVNSQLETNTDDNLKALPITISDPLFSAVTTTLPDGINNLVLTGTSAINGTGNTLDNYLLGNSVTNTLSGLAGNDTLDGAAGNDTLTGGTGNDTYMVDSVSDVISETSTVATEIDSVISSVSYTLGANLETLTLTGTNPVNGTGNTLNNFIIGNAAANILNGSTGADTLSGGDGNDTYYIDNPADIIEEISSTGGSDTVISSISYSLKPNLDNPTPITNGDLAKAKGYEETKNNLENLTLSGTAAINATGNILNNTLTGNTANNILDGDGGDDTLRGGTGNDTYIVDSTGDVISETSTLATEIDIVQATASYTLSANLENLILTGIDNINGTGNASNNTITGNDGGNILNGAAGVDTLIGGIGNDTYVVDTTTDTITEATDGGIDTVESSVAYILGATLENLTLTGTGVINATGNGLSNTLTGNSAANTLTGGDGNDTLIGGDGADTLNGGAGNDTYELTAATSAGSIITDASGTDTLNMADVTLSLTKLAAGSIGFAKVNTTLVIDLNKDGIANATNDLSISDFFASSGNTAGNGFIETVDSLVGTDILNLFAATSGGLNLVGTDANDTLTGGAGNDTLSGGLGNDILNGGAGADTMIGGAGNDTYYVENAGDITTEALNEGIDIVSASLSWTLADNLENLTLTGTTAINGTGNALNNSITGNTAINTLTGGAGNDILNGGTGADTLIGGAGNDTYNVDNIGDITTEALNEGTDTVSASLTWTLADNLENLTLSGTTAINGTGNALNNTIAGNTAVNTLTGGAGNDILNGSAGADTLIGGAGNDTYFVDNVGDITTEALNEGIDIVSASLTWTLADNLENLTLSGTTAINGTGNALNNTINGNAAANTLSGGGGIDTLTGLGGNDILVGGLGNDILTGGTEADSFRFNAANEGVDTIKDFTLAQSDIIQISAAGFGGGLAVGTLDSSMFLSAAGATTATNSSQRFIYNSTNGALFFDADGNGAGSLTIQIATLTGMPALSNTNIGIIA